MLVANGTTTAIGAGTVTGEVGGAQVEQHIDPCEQSLGFPCPQPS
jgi:hypothetical protein